MNVKTNWTIGNFSAALAVETTEEQTAKLASLGLKYLGQRISAVDKTLGGFNGNKRISGWTRDSVAFDEQLAEFLAADFKELEFPADLGGKLSPHVEIGEYVREERELKFTAEKAKIAEKNGNVEKLTALAEAVGFEFEDEAELVSSNVEFCKAIRAYVKALERAL